MDSQEAMAAGMVDNTARYTGVLVLVALGALILMRRAHFSVSTGVN